jgi:hypothetical protein
MNIQVSTEQERTTDSEEPKATTAQVLAENTNDHQGSRVIADGNEPLDSLAASATGAQSTQQKTLRKLIEVETLLDALQETMEFRTSVLVVAGASGLFSASLSLWELSAQSQKTVGQGKILSLFSLFIRS